MKKSKAIELIAEKLNEKINELQVSINAYKDAADIDESEVRDPEDMSHAAESKDMQHQFEAQLESTQKQLEELKAFSAKVHETAESGALIETDHHYFYIGTSFPTITHNGKEILGVSPTSPAFAALMGKAKGDKFRLGVKEYSIKAIA